MSPVGPMYAPTWQASASRQELDDKLKYSSCALCRVPFLYNQPVPLPLSPPEGAGHPSHLSTAIRFHHTIKDYEEVTVPIDDGIFCCKGDRWGVHMELL